MNLFIYFIYLYNLSIIIYQKISLSEIQSSLNNRSTKKDNNENNIIANTGNDLLKKVNKNNKDELMSLSIKKRRELLTRYDGSESDSNDSDWSSQI